MRDGDLMNLKTSYHYSYFVYPFLISYDRYKAFIGKFLEDGDNWELKIRDHQVDLNTHAYFLPYVKKFLFPTLYWSDKFKARFETMSAKKKLDVISKLTSVHFEYKVDKHKAPNYKLSQANINFDISRIELICFEPGICFLLVKTELDKSNGLHSNDILNFNYKFRTINPRYQKKKKTEGIFLKNMEFNDGEDLSDFIDHLLYGYEDVEKENIYFDRLFTYSYMCLDESEWNEDRDLSEIINEFYKFQYILPSDYGSTFDPEFKAIKDNTYTRWKYSIYGFSRESGVVFSSKREAFNINKLPVYYENMYLYIFLLAFYQRITLILFSQELMTSGTRNIDELKDRFTRFTHFSWFSQITNSEQGMDIWKKWQKAFDLPALFDEVQKEYEEFYDFTVAKGQEKINFLLIVIYTISVLFAGMTLMVDMDVIKSDNLIAKILMGITLAATIAGYPIYLALQLLLKGMRKFVKKRSL